MRYWLILWKTWIEGELDTPWPFMLYEKTADFRSRKNPEIRISQDKVDSVLQSYNAELVNDFLEEHVEAWVLATVFEAADSAFAIEIVKAVFQDAEVVKCEEVNFDEYEQVLENLPKE